MKIFCQCLSSIMLFSKLTFAQFSYADSLFKRGKFQEAEVAYSKIIHNEPTNSQALYKIAYINLITNRFQAAEKKFESILVKFPNDTLSIKNLAEAYYRQTNFTKTSKLLYSIGKTSKANQLEFFKKKIPYEILNHIDSSIVKFISTDPLPVISVRINDSSEVYFIIDTGGGEIIIDDDYADKLKLPKFGKQTGEFGGGKKADVEFSAINKLHIGDFEIGNIPVHILNTSKFSAAAGGKKVDGIIGTIFLYQFISTLDYKNEQLILRKKTSKNLDYAKKLSDTKDNTYVSKFWLVEDHLILSNGHIGNGPESLYLIDTGLAGGGFTCPSSTLKEAGIQIPGATTEGEGGGGKVSVAPFMVPEISLGNATAKNLLAFYGPFPPSLEMRNGFRIGGLISHAFFRPYRLTFDFNNMNLILNK